MKDNVNENEVQCTSQAKKILAYMQAGNRITPIDALERFGSFRLGARIADLRADGHEIKSEFVKTATGKRVKAYWIQG
jgi:hypothetical protein